MCILPNSGFQIFSILLHKLTDIVHIIPNSKQAGIFIL
jgi:hypothetical protein